MKKEKKMKYISLHLAIAHDVECYSLQRYNWPMEGSIITYAPPIYKKQSSAPATIPPLRLLTLKNGVRDIRQAVSVVGPDLNNVSKIKITKK